MKRSIVFLITVPLYITSLYAQFSPRIELSTSFPFGVLQNGQRDYYLTTKYSAALSFPLSNFADIVTTATFTQQTPIAIQQPIVTIWASASTPMIRLPFTTDPFYSEHGGYSGVRFMTKEKPMQVFISGQLGIIGRKYGTIERVLYQPEDPLPGSPYSFKEVEGSVINFQFAAMYGIGLTFHPINELSLFVDLHAVDRMTDQPLDVYRTVGIQFGL